MFLVFGEKRNALDDLGNGCASTGTGLLGRRGKRMRHRKEPGVSHKITLDQSVDERLMQILESSRQTLSGFVQDAIVQRMARWEPPTAFIDRKRKKLGHRKQSGFDLSKVHECGWPLKTSDAFWKLSHRPPDEIKNLRALLQYAPGQAKIELAAAWNVMGLGNYSDKEWAITQAWWMENKDAVQSTEAMAEAPSND